MIESEYGSCSPIRFVKATMRDGDGNVVMCGKCGKPAAGGVYGKEAYIAFCSEHSPCPTYEAKFVYKPPKEEK